MDREQESRWLAAQGIAIGVDLVPAALRQLEFLAAVDRRRWLYEGPLLERAIHRYAVETFRDCRYLGTRVRADGTVGDYKWMTYGEASTSRTAIGSGLIYHGVPKGARIGLYFINRPEWIIVDHACAAYSYVSVPLYDTLGLDAVQFIVNHAIVEAIFCVPQTLSTFTKNKAQEQVTQNMIPRRASSKKVGTIVVLKFAKYPNKELVAYATLLSCDPDAEVDGVKLGNQFWKLRITFLIEENDVMVRPWHYYKTIGDAKGKTVAWPSTFVEKVNG